MYITLLILIMMILMLTLTKTQPVWVFVLSVFLLNFLGIVNENIILDSVINHSAILIVLLVLTSLALEKSSYITWITRNIYTCDYKKSLMKLGVITLLSSAFLNNTAVVATMMSSIIKNKEIKPSKLLIPLSYFSILGGILTLIGTSTNLMINGLLIANDLPSLKIFDLFYVGIFIALFCSLIIVLFSYKLPTINIADNEIKDYLLQAKVEPGCPFIGNSVKKNGLRALDGLFLAEILRNDNKLSLVTPETIIESNDILLFTGNISEIGQLTRTNHLNIFPEQDNLPTSNLLEVVINPNSNLVNSTLKSQNFRSRFDAAVIAIKRDARSVNGKLGEQELFAGDKLILVIGDNFHAINNVDDNFIILDSKKITKQITNSQSLLLTVGFLCSIFISISTRYSLIETISFYLFMCVVTRIISTEDMRKKFPFDIWIIISSAIVISSAVNVTGLSSYFSTFIYNILGESSYRIAFISLFFCTVLLTEIMTNAAAAAIMFPIGISLAKMYNVDYHPFVMGIIYASSASFLLPFGYQTNLMVMNVGGYTIRDYLKFGWPVTLTYVTTSLILIPIFFPF